MSEKCGIRDTKEYFDVPSERHLRDSYEMSGHGMPISCFLKDRLASWIDPLEHGFAYQGIK